jgi:GNAT superfamily N-acetyltransferase
MKLFEIRDCDDFEAAKTLIREYSQIKGAESCFVTLEKELADLGAFYEGGAFLIGYEDGKPIATIAIRNIDGRSCEAKRLYIQPEYRGKGYARLLMNAMLDRCRELGFEEVQFTTKPAVMSVGYRLYRRMGFEETGFDGETASMRMMLEK